MSDDPIAKQKLDSPKKKITVVTTKRIFEADDLFAGEREIIIQHGDLQYRLLITKSGKLILNK